MAVLVTMVLALLTYIQGCQERSAPVDRDEAIEITINAGSASAREHEEREPPPPPGSNHHPRSAP